MASLVSGSRCVCRRCARPPVAAMAETAQSMFIRPAMLRFLTADADAFHCLSLTSSERDFQPASPPAGRAFQLARGTGNQRVSLPAGYRSEPVEYLGNPERSGRGQACTAATGRGILLCAMVAVRRKRERAGKIKRKREVLFSVRALWRYLGGTCSGTPRSYHPSIGLPFASIIKQQRRLRRQRTDGGLKRVHRVLSNFLAGHHPLLLPLQARTWAHKPEHSLS